MYKVAILFVNTLDISPKWGYHAIVTPHYGDMSNAKYPFWGKGEIKINEIKSLAGIAPRRRALGLTQEQLAEALHVERARLGMWEIGKSWPSARLLPELADLLLCSIDELYSAAPEEDAQSYDLSISMEG